MSNEFLDAKEYASTLLAMTVNNLVLGRLVDGRYTDQVTDNNGLKTFVKRRPRFLGSTTDATNSDSAAVSALAAEDAIYGEEQVAVTHYIKTHLSFSDLEDVRHVNQLVRNTNAQEVANTLAQRIENFLADKLLEFPSWVGDPGTQITDPDEVNSAHTRLMEQLAPRLNNNGVFSYQDTQKLRRFIAGSNIQNRNTSALERSLLPGVLSDIDIYSTQIPAPLTVGTREATASDGAAAVAANGQNVNYRTIKNNPLLSQTFNITGFGAGETIKKGEVFTIDGVFAYNNRSGAAYPYLRQFTVLEDAETNSVGAVTVTITPAIIVPGTADGTSTVANTAFATVDAAPVMGAAVRFVGEAEETIKQSFAFNKRAIALVSARLRTPYGDPAAFVRDEKTGIGIRYWRGSDIRTGEHIHRWDCVIGATTVEPMFGTRVSGVAPSP